MSNLLLSQRQSWIIDSPYEIEEDDLNFLAGNPLLKAKDWYNPKYKPLKDKIRKYYYEEKQNKTCAYCRLPISGGTDNIEIEHIVDKNNRIDFIFTTLNMVVSCHNCNFTKGTVKVFHECPPENDYPEEKEKYKIIHGHFDDYFENIEFKADSTYHAKNDKGEFTISKCGLDRPRLAEQREETTMYQDDPVVAEVIALRKQGGNEEELNEILNQLRKLRNQ